MAHDSLLLTSRTWRVHYDHPREDVDFRPNGAYSVYNWELFFHAPLLIADRLRKEQRFEAAQRFFHYLFNLTTSSNDPAPDRYWNVLLSAKTMKADASRNICASCMKVRMPRSRR